jgi:hypothetical protein
MLAREGPGLLTVKVKAPLVPPPGVFTVMDNVPAAARSAALRIALNCVPLTNVVVRLAPFTWMVDELA